MVYVTSGWNNRALDYFKLYEGGEQVKTIEPKTFSFFRMTSMDQRSQGEAVAEYRVAAHPK